MELLTHSCHAEMSFFCPEEGAGNSYLHNEKEKHWSNIKPDRNDDQIICFCSLHKQKILS